MEIKTICHYSAFDAMMNIDNDATRKMHNKSRTNAHPSVVIVHDYITQRGGAERVLLELVRAFPGATVVTSLYRPEATFPEFADVPIVTLGLNRVRFLRNNHRNAFPVLAPAFSWAQVKADVVICSSSGWAHGIRSTGNKIVYCYAPARWLYQAPTYLGKGNEGNEAWWRASDRKGRIRHHSISATGLRALAPILRRWDQRAAQSANFYVTSSSFVADAIRKTYGIDPRILPPPPALTPDGPMQEVVGIDPGYLLCVARLLPYKNIEVVVRSAHVRTGRRLIVVGEGPCRRDLERLAGANVRFLSNLCDEQLRWLYCHATALVSAAHEDYGLTPLEAASFGVPSVVLRAGGFLDTVVDGKTGVFFDRVEPKAIEEALNHLATLSLDRDTMINHADRFSAAHFRAELVAMVAGALS